MTGKFSPGSQNAHGPLPRCRIEPSLGVSAFPFKTSKYARQRKDLIALLNSLVKEEHLYANCNSHG